MDKKYYVSESRMTRTAMFYFIVALPLLIGFVFMKSLFFIFPGILAFVLSIIFYVKRENHVQFKIKNGQIHYHERTGIGKPGIADFYNLFLNDDFDTMDISLIQQLELVDSFWKGRKLSVINHFGNRIPLLLEENSELINEIYHDLNQLLEQNLPKKTLDDRIKKQIIDIDKEHESTKIIIEKTPNRMVTQVYTNYKNKPNFKNTLLVSETITAILTYMQRLYEPLDIEPALQEVIAIDPQNEEWVRQTQNFISKVNMEDAKNWINQKFEACRIEYNSKSIDYIFETSLSPTKNDLYLQPELESFIKELLIQAEYGDLLLDSAIIRFRSR